MATQSKVSEVKCYRYLYDKKRETVMSKQLVPMQPGDVPTTYADASALERDFGLVPKVTLREGLRKFAEWYASYYQGK